MKTDAMATRLAKISRLTPNTGVNVVGRDDPESDPERELYFVAHCATVAEADAVACYRLLQNPNERLFAYSCQPKPTLTPGLAVREALIALARYSRSTVTGQ